MYLKILFQLFIFSKSHSLLSFIKFSLILDIHIFNHDLTINF